MAVGLHKKGDEVCPNPPHGCVICCPTNQRILPNYIFVSELEMHAAVFQALGYASVCWDEAPTGVFQDQEASRVGEELIGIINKYKIQYPERQPQPHQVVIMVSDGMDWAAVGISRAFLTEEDGLAVFRKTVEQLDDHLEESAAKRRVSG